jgi:hypothetical protein
MAVRIVRLGSPRVQGIDRWSREEALPFLGECQSRDSVHVPHEAPAGAFGTDRSSSPDSRVRRELGLVQINANPDGHNLFPIRSRVDMVLWAQSPIRPHGSSIAAARLASARTGGGVPAQPSPSAVLSTGGTRDRFMGCL